MKDFNQEVMDRLAKAADNAELARDASSFMRSSVAARYSYNFNWLGRPIIQYPQDILAVQEIVWKTRPDLIIETGIAHGGSLILHASLLALLDYADAVESSSSLDPGCPRRRVLGVDIDIREHNRRAVLEHPMTGRIDMIQGSSVDPSVVEEVRRRAGNFPRVMLCLDSNHTHEHVLAELEAYAGLVTKGCYCVVFDTLIEYMPDDQYPDRPWAIGNNPMTAVREFLSTHNEFRADTEMDAKLQVSVAPGGYLVRE